MMRVSNAMQGLLMVVCLVLVGACGTREPVTPTSGTEIQRVHAGDLDVVLFSPGETVPAGKAPLTIEFQKPSDHSLVDVGDVRLRATMPMPGFPDMQANIVATKGVPGRYAVEADLGMKGAWTIGVEWNGPAGSGMATLNATAQ